MRITHYKFLVILATIFFLCSANVADAKPKHFDAPNISAEFDLMAYPHVYPTYSWEPLANTEFYQVQVIREDNGKETVVREIMNMEGFNRATDWLPFTDPGNYFWRVRVVNKKQKPLSDWSARQYFKVTAPVTFAVIGDSISHGGANYIPAGQLSCQWETYCEVPVKNIARSGDTTAGMIDRFNRDVLAFSPQVLIILGGVNDIREGASAEEVIKNLEKLRDLCAENNITPIFATLTPMNPKIMKERGIPLTDNDWQSEREKINAWIVNKTIYNVDVTEGLNDENGYLREDLTPDGLHPALRGKMMMGKAVEKCLKNNFPDLVKNAK